MRPYEFHHIKMTADEYNRLWGFWQKLKIEYCAEQGYLANHPFYLVCEENRRHCMQMNMNAMGFRYQP